MKIKDSTLIKATNEDIIDGKFIVPDGIEKIGLYVFRDCISLQSIVLPEGIEGIGWGAFQGCASLTHIILPKRLEWIDSWAFRDCTSLQSIFIPMSLKKIGWGAFQGCTNLNDVVGGNMELVNKVRLQTFLGRTPPSEKMIEWNKLANK